jgi:L-methionine (R)-S-oxide reductase
MEGRSSSTQTGPPGCGQASSAREGARALSLPEGGVRGNAPLRLFPACTLTPSHRRYTVHVEPEPADQDPMDAIVAGLHHREPAFDWVGVYMLQGSTLVLGPFRGVPTEHERIPLGEGVCGSVAATGHMEVVPDVRLRPGHIACDLNTRSEAVAPIVRDGEVLGVMDVDSNTLNAFGPREMEVIEDAARKIAESTVLR